MKKELRKRIIALRQKLSRDEVLEKSSVIFQKVINLEQYKRAKVVMTFLSIRNEVETEPFIIKAMSDCKRIIIPVCQKDTITLIPAEVKHYPEDLEPGTWGILEPKPEAFYPIDPKEIDLVIVPGVAFDEWGNRLGYGSGYYDRFLTSLPSSILKIAVAFDLQIVSEVYPEEHDQPVDVIITEKCLLNLIK
jgi:5-formyltetrahydrofolate cyclo-ligase